MYDGIVNLLQDAADVMVTIGTNLAMNAQHVAENPEMADRTAIRVFWDLSMLPLTDKIGDLMNHITSIITAIAELF